MGAQCARRLSLLYMLELIILVQMSPDIQLNIRICTSCADGSGVLAPEVMAESACTYKNSAPTH